MGQFSMTISAVAGSVLRVNQQHRFSDARETEVSEAVNSFAGFS